MRIFIILAIAVYLSAEKIPYINNLIYEVSKSDFDKNVVKTHRNKTYKQHYSVPQASQYKFIGFYKDFAMFFFNGYKTGIFENDGYIYTSKDDTGIQSAYILVKKEKNTVYLKGHSFLLGHFRLVGVRDLFIYPFYNLKAIEIKKVKIK